MTLILAHVANTQCAAGFTGTAQHLPGGDVRVRVTRMTDGASRFVDIPARQMAYFSFESLSAWVCDYVDALCRELAC